ncbi:MAG: lysylphosphatidylglycerol synthase transmembrane domain-containing protein [Vicinamibacterales bacterium]
MARWLLRTTVSIVVVLLLLRVVPLGAVIGALRRISWPVWVASLGVFVAGHYLNALKLRLLIGEPSAPMQACVRAQYAGLVANLGLPGIAGGDLVRAAYLAPLVGTRRVVVASLADRVLDSLTLLMLVAIALPIAGVPEVVASVVRTGGWWVGVAAVAGCGVLALAFLMRRTPGALSGVADVWRTLASRRLVLSGAVAISVGVQSAFVLTNMWLARSVGVGAGVAPWFVAWPLSKLIAVLPISLGGIGVREAALVSLLAPYGAARDGVLATGVLWQAVLTVSGLGGLVVTQLLGARAGQDAPPVERA